MKRVGWGILSTVVAVAGFAFNWLVPRGNEFALVDIDLQLGSQRPTPSTQTVEGTKPSDAQGLSVVFNTVGARISPRSDCLDAAVIRGARVVALGAYEGGEPTSLAFAGEGDEVSKIVVQADEQGPPLVIILNAYDPVLWDFAGFPDERLRGVIVYGYSEQAVAHLKGSIPVRFATRSLGATSCGTYVYAYKQSPDLVRLREQVQAVLGVPLNAFYGSYSPNAFHADGSSSKPLAPVRLNRSQLRSSGPVQQGGLLPGDQGLRQLMEQGAIRPAKSADWAQWQRVSGEKPDTFLDAYVVLRSTEVPRGMYGAHSRAFIIPAGVPLPSDPGSHNRYYRLKDGTCVSCL